MVVEAAAPHTSAGAHGGGARSAGYRYLCVVILALAYTFNFLDRQLLSILAEPVRKDLHLSDSQLGLLTGFAFALFYTLFGVPIAWAADRTHRVRIVAAACATWSLFSAAGGLAGNFTQLALARLGVGVGEAGGATPSYAIIADLFPARRRGAALALYSLGVPLGLSFGAALGAGIAAHYGWRIAFFVVGLPGLLVALLILLVVREPVRGAQDLASAGVTGVGRAGLGEVVRLFFSNPVLRWTALASGLSAFAGYGTVNWTPAFLMRHQHMTLAQIATVYSVCIGVSVGVGTWVSGWLADRLSVGNPRAYAQIPMWGALACVPFIFAGYLAPGWRSSLVFLTVSGALGILYLAPALTVVQNTVAPSARSTSAALLLLVLNLIGLGGGPLFVGVVSDALKPGFGGGVAADRPAQPDAGHPARCRRLVDGRSRARQLGGGPERACRRRLEEGLAEPGGGERGLVRSLKLKHHVLELLELARAFLLHRDQRRDRAHPRARAHGRHEADAVEAVVHRHAQAFRPRSSRAGLQPRQDRQQQEAVRDRSAEGRGGGALGIDVDELAIAGRLGEAVDHGLVDQQPVRSVGLADLGLHQGQRRRGHGGVLLQVSALGAPRASGQGRRA